MVVVRAVISCALGGAVVGCANAMRTGGLST
jgi:hypothetical protein